ncbi:MAG: gliding motility-associated-like protein [Saprospiraceae bacterium]|jgi:gliding motility-associated-like protein
MPPLTKDFTMSTSLLRTGGQSRNFTHRLRQFFTLFSVLIYLPLSLSANERPFLSFSEKTFIQLKDALLSQLTDLSQTAANLNKQESEASVKSNATLIPCVDDTAGTIGFSSQFMETAIGDFAFKDCDSDGIQDGTEEGLEGVIVNLTGIDINGLTVNKMTLTDTDGFYIFDTLVAGTYTVFFDFPVGSEGLAYGRKDEGSSDLLDSDIDIFTGITDPIILSDGERNLSIDAAFVDIQLPTAVGLVDPLILGCNDTIPDLLFTDNCSDTIVIINSSEFIAAQDSCETRTKRSWLISDGCGNVNSICQTVIQRDDNPPVGTPAPDTLILCPDDTINLPIPLFVDDCDLYLDVTMNTGIIPVSDCEYQIHRFFEATDNCGNSTNVLQIVTVKDTAAVTIVSEPQTVDFECSIGVLEEPVVMNSCGEILPLNVDTTYVPADCANRFIANINYTSANACYNYDFTHTVNITDDIGPELVGVNPVDITIECGGTEPPLTLEFTDNCGGAITQTPSSSTTQLVCGSTISQSITATDICGNSVTISRTINVIDTTEPTLSGVPADELADCEGTTNIPPPADVTATDICDGDVPVIFTETQQNMACEGSYMIIRTWTATDECGNSTSQSQTITVGDDGPPIIEGVPADLTVECELPELPTVTANDNCGTVNLQFTESTSADTCTTYQVTRTWTATDDCGNVSTKSYTITVEITTPTAVNMPAVLTYECNETIPDAETPVIMEGCYSAMITDFTETNEVGDCPQEYSLIREWTVSDECGNHITITQIVNVVDTVAPILTVLEPMLQGLEDGDSIYIECDAMISLNENGATAVDNCDDDLQVMFMEMPGENADCLIDGYIAHMICGWKAIDDCGNQGQILINFFIIDHTEPMLFGVPNDVDESCNYDLTPPNVGVMDNCDLDIEVEMTETETGEPCNRVIVRKWIATDHCGNMVMQSQTISLSDIEDPVLVGVPADAVVSCNQVPEVPVVTATDDCSDDLIVSFAQNIYGLTCDEQQINRVWSVTDNCGNTTTVQQTITILDDTAPVLAGIPNDVTVACDSIPTPANVSVNDDCDEDIEVVFTENETGTSCENRQIVRTWSVTDDCGNSVSDTQVITVEDNNAPVLSGVPADITIECGATPAVPNVIANDNCDDDVQVSFEETIIGNTCNEQQIIRIWTAIDDCGNVSTGAQTITLTDDTPPVLTGIPADITTECDAIPLPAVPSVSDDCDNDIDIEYTSTEQEGNCTYNYSIVRTWIATDNCGNITEEQQIITVQDTQAPVISLINPILDGYENGDTIFYQCDADIFDIGDATSIDNCDADPTLNFVELIIDDNPCSTVLACTWIAEDLCGNSMEFVIYIKIEDTTPPVFDNIPLDITADCNNLPPIDDITATDNCNGEVTIELIENSSGTNCENSQITRLFIATDQCGNSTVVSQIITVSDNESPVLIGVPEDTMLECHEDLSPANVTATDDCDSNVEVIMTEETISGSCENEYTIIRTWTASDDCGNEVSATQTIMVKDITPPIFIGVPDNISIECNELLPPPTIGDEIKAVDLCDTNVSITFEEEYSGEDCSDYQLIRTWTATDNCGNMATATQVISLTDNTAPTLSNIPQDLDYQCNAPTTNDLPTATDACHDDVEIIVEEGQVDLDCGYIIIRIFTATDDCGNSTTASQTITVIDTIPPVFSIVPSDLNLECDEEIPELSDASATDNCGDVTITVEETTEQSTVCENNYTITRIYTATDDCGNTSTITQTISVTDTTAPTLIFDEPELMDLMSGDTLFLECDGLINMEDAAIITDNCDDNPNVVFNEETMVSEDCEADGYLVKLLCTWELTDDCGNTSTFILNIIIADNTPPVIFCPEDITVNTGEDQSLPDPTEVNVVDNCTDNIVLDVNESMIPDADECGYTLVRVYTATDECGNSMICEQNITVEEFCECPDIIVNDTDNDPTSCAGDDGIYDVTLEDAAAYDYVLVPNYGAANDIGNTRMNLPVGDYLLVISQPDIDTCEMKLYFTILDGCTNCDTEVFANSEISIELIECDDLGKICLTIEDESITDYSILLNNEPYTGSLVGCTFDTTYNYATAAIPSWGMAGPYTVTNWSVNGVDYSAEFNDLTELMNLMNDWDPTGNWILSMGSITGGNTSNLYSSMQIYQNNTGAAASLMKNSGTAAVGIAVEAPLGEHEFIFTHNQTGCADTANVSVYCSPVIAPSNSELFIPNDSSQPFCLDVSELPGNVVSIESICETESAEQYAILTSFNSDYCLNVNGLEMGEQDFCFEICDDFGFCDTSYLQVTVTEQIFLSDEMPVAIEDNYTLNEGEPITIDVCLNDQLNGALESHSLRTLPQTGTAILRGNEIEYTPENNVCQDITFVYEICNDMGCDEAEVTLHYLCDNVIIFNGFSPNNDSFNDAFTILGLERYPNHSIQVFNRWGSKVFEGLDYQNDWKGTNADNDLPDGTYFYLFDNGEGDILSGYVAIRR